MLSEPSSGLPVMPDNLSYDINGIPDTAYSDDDLIKFLRDHKLNKSSPSFRYSNSGTALLSLVMEHATDKEFTALLNEHVISPFELKNTMLEVPVKKQGFFTDGSKQGKNVPHWDIFHAMAPAGGLRSTSEDLAIFLSAFLRDSNYRNTRNYMQKIRYSDNISDINVATGWFMNSSAKDNIYWVAGSTGGFSSFAGYSTSDNRFAIMLSNSNISLTESGLKILKSRAP